MKKSLPILFFLLSFFSLLAQKTQPARAKVAPSNGTTPAISKLGKLIIAGDASPVTSVGFSNFSPDSLYLLTGGKAQQIRVWDAVYSDAQGFTLSPKNYGPYSTPNGIIKHVKYNAPTVFNPYDPSLFIAAAGNSWYEYDLENEELYTSQKSKPEISRASIAVSIGGDSLLISDFQGGVQLLERRGKRWKEIWEENVPSNYVTSLTFSPDGDSFLAAVNNDKTPSFGSTLKDEQSDQPSNGKGFPVILYSADDFSVLNKFGTSADQAAFSPDGKWVATNEAAGLSVFNSENSKTLFHIGNTAGNVMSLAFSPDSKSVVAGFSNNSIIQYDLNGKVIRVFKGHDGPVLSLAFSPKGESRPAGKFLLSGSNDRTAKIWDVAKGIELATLIAIGEEDWAITTPNKLFDASEDAMTQLYYQTGKETISLDQLTERYYEPGLLRKIIFNEPLRKVESLDNQDLALYPQLIKSELVGDVIKVQIKKRSGGIGRVSVLINSKNNSEIIEDANTERKENFEIDLLRYSPYFISGEPNSLSLVFYAENGWLPSAPDTIIYTPSLGKGKGNKDKPNPKPGEVSLNDELDANLKSTLYALIVGTSKYQVDSLNLQFPDIDASDFKNFLEKASAELFDNRVKIRLLTTAKKGTPPTIKNIRSVINEFASAEPQDVFLVYFSGHGLTWPENNPAGQFYLLSSENSSFDLTDPANKQKAIGQDTLEKWFKKVKALKKILILDACNSGQFIKKMETGGKGANSFNDDQRRAMQRMKDRAGFFVLAGSAADKLSYEDPRFGHGLLTYSLLKNMPFVAAKDDYKYIDVFKLFQEVNDEVPKLASKLNKVQEPKIIGAADFSIGQIKDASKYKLPDEKKIIANSNFFNEKGNDNLNLSESFNDQLEKIFEYNTDLQFNYYNIEEKKLNGPHYSMKGPYKTTETDITGTAYFFDSTKPDNELKSFPFNGKKTDVKKIAEDLANKLIDFLNTLK
jgi:WD40 repeat protein